MISSANDIELAVFELARTELGEVGAAFFNTQVLDGQFGDRVITLSLVEGTGPSAKYRSVRVSVGWETALHRLNYEFFVSLVESALSLLRVYWFGQFIPKGWRKLRTRRVA